MAEYIERQALLAEYDRVHVGPPGGARKLIEEAIAADVVPVVRCKDCEHSFVLGESDLQNEPPYKFYRKDVLMCGCEEHFGDYPESVDVMFFCGYGERKETDSNG